MTIYKSVIKKILNELENRDEVMAHLNLDPDMYHAYMLGRMLPIMEALSKAEKIEIGG